MVDEEKLCSPVPSAFEALVVRHEVGRCCGRRIGPFLLTNADCRCCGFGAFHSSAEHTSQM